MTKVFLAGCNYFVTANIKDFKKGEVDKLPVLKPDEFLVRFSG